MSERMILLLVFSAFILGHVLTLVALLTPIGG